MLKKTFSLYILQTLCLILLIKCFISFFGFTTSFFFTISFLVVKPLAMITQRSYNFEVDKTSETPVFHFYSQTKSYLINKATTLKSAEKTPRLAADRLNLSGVVWSRRKRNIFPSFLYAGLLVPRSPRRRRRHTVSQRNLKLIISHTLICLTP